MQDLPLGEYEKLSMLEKGGKRLGNVSEGSGESCAQVASPDQYEGFKNISRIVVDLEDSDIIILATSDASWVEFSGYAIWKS